MNKRELSNKLIEISNKLNETTNEKLNYENHQNTMIVDLAISNTNFEKLIEDALYQLLKRNLLKLKKSFDYVELEASNIIDEIIEDAYNINLILEDDRQADIINKLWELEGSELFIQTRYSINSFDMLDGNETPVDLTQIIVRESLLFMLIYKFENLDIDIYDLKKEDLIKLIENYYREV